MALNPGPVFHKFLTPGPKEKCRILSESTPALRIRDYLWLLRPDEPAYGWWCCWFCAKSAKCSIQRPFLHYGTPSLPDPLKGMYQASRTMLLSHATAWRLYDSKYRAKQCGMVSITLNSDWAEPKHPDKDEDRRAADDYLQVRSWSRWTQTPRIALPGGSRPWYSCSLSLGFRTCWLAKNRMPRLFQVHYIVTNISLFIIALKVVCFPCEVMRALFLPDTTSA